MIFVTIHQAKANLSRLIRKSSQGEEVIIARGTKPVSRLVPVGEVKGKRQPGSLKDKSRVGPEFFEPLPAHTETGEIYNFLAGKGVVAGDVVSPAVSPKEWGELN
jgi:prevent-host-death family protein